MNLPAIPMVAAQLYRALKNKPCGCGLRVLPRDDGKREIAFVKCGGCVAIEAYEAVAGTLACQ